MEYHEIGERFEYDGVMLEVVEGYGSSQTDCVGCAFANSTLCLGSFCTHSNRKDGKNVYYKLIEICKPKDMEQKTETKNTSKKNDRIDDKPMWELLPLQDIEDVVKVYTAGAKKYGPDQWQNLPDGYNRYKAALFRHLVEYEKGNWLDEETGCIHLAQVAWNAIAMLHIEKERHGNK